VAHRRAVRTKRERGAAVFLLPVRYVGFYTFLLRRENGAPFIDLISSVIVDTTTCYLATLYHERKKADEPEARQRKIAPVYRLR